MAVKIKGDNMTKEELVAKYRKVRHGVYRIAIARLTKLHRANLLNTIDYLEYGEKLLSPYHCITVVNHIDKLYVERLGKVI